MSANDKQQTDHYQAIVIGSGQGATPLCMALAAAGLRTVIIERRHVGGTCINEGCTPTKTMVASGRVAYLARRGADYGVHTGDIRIDLERVRKRKRDIVDSFRNGSQGRIERTPNLELVFGEASFNSPKSVFVRLNDGRQRTLTGERIFINAGARPAVPKLAGLADVPFLNSTSIMELDTVPSHLLVLGGGYVGLELAQAYRRFGSRVTVIETGAQLMAREDPDVVDEVHRIFREEGIQFLLQAQTLSVQGRSGDGVSLTVRTPSGEQKIESSDILVAAGRVPNTAGIGLEETGVELDARGYIRVNERLETTAPNVWAIGECAGSPQFTHVSIDDFRIIRDNLAGANRSTRGRLVPYCMFTEPPLAHVGLSEREAQQRNVTVRVTRLPMSGVRRTATTEEILGFMKVLVGTSDDRILGFTMIGAEAGEVMAVVQTAMLADLPYPKLRDAILAHPTMSEGLGDLFANVPPRSDL